MKKNSMHCNIIKRFKISIKKLMHYNITVNVTLFVLKKKTNAL